MVAVAVHYDTQPVALLACYSHQSREGYSPEATACLFELAYMIEAHLVQEATLAHLARTAVQRHSDKPFFIDKLPNNWIYLAFIRLILPNAKIIDARRHPLDCCFSNYRQHFAKGQAFSYDLAHLGQYYADYVRLMAHFDAVEPGSVYRIIHEQLLENPEGEIRSLLEFLDLPFEESCLNFHQNKRAVRTASSEQVRRPINRDGVDQWKPYAAHLEPLKRALGAYWKTYPALL